MKATWVMICLGFILDKCLASSKEEASKIFKSRSRYEDWSESDILPEGDYFAETELNSLESQTYEG